MALISCPECGKEISDKVKNCPHCGYPIDDEEIEINEEAKKQNSRKKIIIISVVLIMALIAIYGIGYKIKTNNENKYLSKYMDLYYSLLDYASICEEITNDVYTVWTKSIEQDANDRYNIYNDFNTNISYLYSGDEYKDNKRTAENSGYIW